MTPIFEVFKSDREEGLTRLAQMYRLDRALIAMGVIDILPTCVLSVY